MTARQDFHLPRGWTMVRLDEVVQTSSGGTPSSKNTAYYGGDIPWVKIGDLTDGHVSATEQTITELGLDCSSAKLLPAGTVLVAMYGSIGKLGILDVPAATNQAICAMQPSEVVDRDYLFWFLRANREYLMSLGRGGNQKNIGQGDLKPLLLPVPPLAEQRRIVAALEHHLTSIADGEARIRAAQDSVHPFRRSVLDEALGGCVAPRGPGPSKLPELPAGWEWSTVADEGTVQLGRMLNKERSSGPHMRPYLRVANVLDNRIDFSDVKEMDFPPAEFERYELKPGDILLNEGQSPELLGRPAMYHGEMPGVCFQKTLLRFQVGARVDGGFALLVFRYYLYSGRFRRESRITTGIGHLTAERFTVMEFPVPPLQEQHRIVRETAGLLDGADELQRALEAARRDAVNLRRSLLHQAFRSGLATQLDDDEPARELLDRLPKPSARKKRRAVLVAE
ncbi:MAG: hypothetical protein JWL77_7154 [Chthonomonadaceae bacterium]|nr:hypothetical protein [Chthonomonadaceae bacterium]